jgi:hypothetical protein
MSSVDGAREVDGFDSLAELALDLHSSTICSMHVAKRRTPLRGFRKLIRTPPSLPWRISAWSSC